MARGSRSRVKGTRKLRRKLAAMKGSVRGQVLTRAAAKGAEPIQREASRRAPVSPGGPTRGERHLEDAILIEPRKITDPFRGEAAVGPAREQFHGVVVELGGRNRAARPYLRPAFDGKKVAAVDAIGREVARILRVAAALTR